MISDNMSLIEGTPRTIALVDKLMNGLRKLLGDVERRDAIYWCGFRSILRTQRLLILGLGNHM